MAMAKDDITRLINRKESRTTIDTINDMPEPEPKNELPDRSLYKIKKNTNVNKKYQMCKIDIDLYHELCYQDVILGETVSDVVRRILAGYKLWKHDLKREQS